MEDSGGGGGPYDLIQLIKKSRKKLIFKHLSLYRKELKKVLCQTRFLSVKTYSFFDIPYARPFHGLRGLVPHIRH